MDGSAFAETAVPLALRVAKAASGSLHVVLAHQVLTPVVPLAETGGVAPALEVDLRTQELDYLTRQAELLGKRGGPEVTHAFLEGPAGPAIVAEARRVGADLVVMAAHGRGALGRLLLGGVTEHIVRHATMPVLVVRPEDGESTETSLRRLLVPLDLSSDAEAVLGIVGELAVLFQSTVSLLHVVEPYVELADPSSPNPVAVDAGLRDTRVADAERRLEQAAASLRDAGILVEARVVEAASAAGAILDLLEKDQADLVAMTAHGAGLRRLLLGSVVDKVIRGTRTPALVARPAAKQTT